MIDLVTLTVLDHLIIFKKSFLITYIYLIFRICTIELKKVIGEMFWSTVFVTKSITIVITDKDTENVNVCKIMLVLLVREGQRFCIMVNI